MRNSFQELYVFKIDLRNMFSNPKEVSLYAPGSNQVL